MDSESKIVGFIQRTLGDEFEVLFDASQPQAIADITKSRIIGFQLKQHKGHFIELHLTSYKGPLEIHSTVQEPAYILVAPIIHTNGQRVAFQPTFINATEVDEDKEKAVNRMLRVPVNRLKNSVSPFSKVLKTAGLLEMLLDQLRPVAVARLEMTCTSARSALLSAAVDETFWRKHFAREFGVPASTSRGPQISFRKRYFEQMNLQRYSAMQLHGRFIPSPPPLHSRRPCFLRPQLPQTNPFRPRLPPTNNTWPPANPFDQPEIFPNPARPRRPGRTSPIRDPMPWMPRPGRGGGNDRGGGGFFGGGGSGGFGGIV